MPEQTVDNLKPPHIQTTLFEVGSPAERILAERDYNLLESPELRTQYVALTERLIAGAVYGSIEELVFLDKSARPVAWLVRELWPLLGIDDNGDHVPMPNMRFVNIDREQWGPIVGRSEDREGGIDVSKIHPSVINDLRTIFRDHTSATQGKTCFDQKNVMIVDEVKASGDTLSIARGIFSLAFPEAQLVDSAYWMTPLIETQPGGARVNMDLPIWYQEINPHGRGVADRNEKLSEISNTRTQRIGRMWLSARFPYQDGLGLQLRREMHQLGDEVREGIIPVIPSGLRSIVATEKIINDVNNLSLAEYKMIRETSRKMGIPLWQASLNYRLERSLENHPAGGASQSRIELEEGA